MALRPRFPCPAARVNAEGFKFRPVQSGTPLTRYGRKAFANGKPMALSASSTVIGKALRAEKSPSILQLRRNFVGANDSAAVAERSTSKSDEARSIPLAASLGSL